MAIRTKTELKALFETGDTLSQSSFEDLFDSLAREIPVIAGTDAAVTMLANRHYELEGSALSADRIYELPAGAVGDRIRVSLLSGNASFELILRGASGITINGGSAATEWSRLFIARECVEFRATSATNWDVWDDGRIPCVGVLEATSSLSVSANVFTQVLFNTESSNCSSASHANDRLTARRAGRYDFAASWLSGSVNAQTILAITRNGPTISPERRFASMVFTGSTSNPLTGVGPIAGGAYATQGVGAAGDTFELIVYVAEFSATAFAVVPYLPRFAFTEVLF